MMPGQELVEIAVRPAVGDALKRFREPGEGIDAVHFGGLQKLCVLLLSLAAQLVPNENP